MKTSDFDFFLPEELIAQTPLDKRDNSKLLLLNKENGDIFHDNFFNIKNYFKKGDVLVLNNTKVIPARLHGIKEDTKAHIEILMLKEEDNGYQCLVKPAKRVKEGTIIYFSDKLKAKCVGCMDEGIRQLVFIHDGILLEILEELGEMPLPPYIKEKLKEKDRYQTVYAKYNGSAAAPTAGLHFTNELLSEIKEMGVTICYVTLHVGLGTFRPVNVEDVNNHKMHSEFYMMDGNTADILNKAKLENKRIISVGTTSVRVLETIMSNHNKFIETSGYTDIFIYPGYEFKAIDCLITNFHLPKSTLLMLISALAKKENVLYAYEQAVKNNYRFFSFGDSMFITDKW
ncbi:MAG: tRNA preQ1(34) S-adenosylmethionine ribosyltransferase-isomerase QueA [Mycoplasmatota bacterium]